MCSDEYQSARTTVIPNAKLTGKLSGVQRQVDVLIDSRLTENRTRRIIVDAKRYKRKLNVKDIDSFHGMMIDCSANKGMLVCASGYSKAALKRAQDLMIIRIVTPVEIENIDFSTWDSCLSHSCNAKKERGLVLWDSPMGIGAPSSPISITLLGKCDRCLSFHIWCWGCGIKYTLGNEDELKCECSVPWFWLTSIENDSTNDKEVLNSVYLLLITPTGALVGDRRPL